MSYRFDFGSPLQTDELYTLMQKGYIHIRQRLRLWKKMTKKVVAIIVVAWHKIHWHLAQPFNAHQLRSRRRRGSPQVQHMTEILIGCSIGLIHQIAR